MVKAYFVKRARKARPKHGIKRGMSYWFFKFYRCPKQYSLTRPKPSQLTRSEFLGAVLAAQESVEEALAGMNREANGEDDDMLEDAAGDVISALESAKEAVEEQRAACEERAESISAAFPNGCPTIALLNERREGCEALADEIEAARDTVEAAETPGEVEEAVGQIGWERF